MKSKVAKRRSYIKSWRKQTKKPITDKTMLLFGKYRLQKVSDVRVNDPSYYQWLCETFTVTPPQPEVTP